MIARPPFLFLCGDRIQFDDDLRYTFIAIGATTAAATAVPTVAATFPESRGAAFFAAIQAVRAAVIFAGRFRKRVALGAFASPTAVSIFFVALMVGPFEVSWCSVNTL